MAILENVICLKWNYLMNAYFNISFKTTAIHIQKRSLHIQSHTITNVVVKATIAIQCFMDCNVWFLLFLTWFDPYYISLTCH